MNLVKQIWTTESIKGVAGHTANHKHEQYDWSGTEDPVLREYMEKLTEPGATKMWDGWFTMHWIPIIMDMARRQNNNAKRTNTHKLAVTTAEKVRNVIKQGLYEMWKVRNEIKHEERVKHKWTKKEIEGILRQLKKTRAIERHSVEEILTWRKRKIDEWAKRRQSDIKQGKKKQQDDREAMHRFRTRWNLFQPNQLDQTKHKQKASEPTTEHGGKIDLSNHSEQSKAKTTKETEMTTTDTTEANSATADKHKDTRTNEQKDRTDATTKKTNPKSTANNKRKRKRKEHGGETGKETTDNHTEPNEIKTKHKKKEQEEQTKRKKHTSELEQQPRKKTKQLTIEQYINKNRKRTRKQPQRTPHDAEKNDTTKNTEIRNTKRPKKTNKRPQTETERKGIG